ncbi:MAG: hypothetical protein C0498_02655 [Anaerolinea sp.]|jgi:hypothetical protein|nr:hypothetical protein [Anaerolinea sp.]
MSVNLSPRQFADPGLVGSIADILRRTGLEPSALELEITETSVMDRSEAGLRAHADLRTLGVRLVLDDFGTGWSSLAYLRQMPLDLIKIDRSFVTQLDEADRKVAIVRAVLSLAHGPASASSPRASRRRVRPGAFGSSAATWARATSGPGHSPLSRSSLSSGPGPVSACCRAAAAGTGRG